jgi:hypothetical protein
MPITSTWGTEMRRLLAATALLVAFGGCDVAGDDDDESRDADAGSRETERRGAPVEGTYVGRVEGTQAFVAVAAAPAVENRRRREIAIFACDAAEVCEWFAGSAAGNSFSAESSDGDARARGNVTRRAATGGIELEGGETIEYTARRATAAAGLYTLTVSPNGRLQGASAGGVGLRGRSTLPEPGRGTLRLADGTRLRFSAVRSPRAEALRIRAREARLIVLSDGRLRGAGTSFYLRSRR